MDRESLARRNMNEAQALHQPSTLHTFRGAFLSFLAKLPVIPQRTTADRLLVIRPDHLGDVLLMMPAIRLIKLQRPDTELNVICGTWAAELLAPFDEIDLVLTLDFPGFQRQRVSVTRNPYLMALDSARMLREIGYGSALVMRPDHWWGAMLAFLAGIPERIGYDKANIAPFLTGRLPHQHEHAILQNMRLAQFWLGIPPGKDIDLTLPVSPADIATIDQLLSTRQIAPDQTIVCIHPGSGMTSKLWQCDKWAAVADQVAQVHRAAIVFTGSAAESALINDIVARMKAKAYSVAGATKVGQLAALYRRSCLVLGPDSGTMHMAAAVHTPTVTLFGPADPIEFAPWGDERHHAVVTSSIACRPCRILDWRDDPVEYHPCVRDINVSQVLEETQRVVQTGNAED